MSRAGYVGRPAGGSLVRPRAEPGLDGERPRADNHTMEVFRPPGRAALVLGVASLLALPVADAGARAHAPHAPSHLRVVAAAAHTVTIGWTARSPRARTQLGVRRRDHRARHVVASAASGRTRAVIRGLTPSTALRVAVRACRAGRCSPWTGALRAATTAASGGPGSSASPSSGSTGPAAGSTGAPGPGTPGPGTRLGGCSVFPADNAWNEDVSALPLHPRSDAWVASIDAGATRLHPDFGSNPGYGIPITIAPQATPPVPITFNEYGDQSDPGPYPVPAQAAVEAGGDRHVLVLHQGSCRLYELYHAQHASGGGWSAGSGAAFDLSSNALRPLGWTSADAAGLPILPGLARFDEVRSGVITHALRFTISDSQAGFIAPAVHQASSDTSPDVPPMGARFRLKAGFDTAGFPPDARVILDALKRYGMIVADNGSDWFISGATDSRWDDDQLDALKAVPGSAFEAVDTGPVQHG